MSECVKCQKPVGKFEVFPGQICVVCYGIEFQKEWKRVLVNN